MAKVKPATGGSPPPVDTKPAKEAVEEAQEALEAVTEAAEDGDAEEFAKLLNDLQAKITAAETEIKQWKAETEKQGQAIAPMNSTLASLSSEMRDIKEQLRELSDKLMTATQSRQSPPATPSADKVTPALAVVPPNSLSQASDTIQVPVEQPAQIKPENASTPAATKKRFNLV